MSTDSPTPLQPVSRRALQLAGLLSLLLIAVVVNSLLHGGGESAFNPLASAAERMEKGPGERFTLHFVYSTPALPQPVVADGSGAENAETGLSRTVVQMRSPLTGELLHMVSISDGKYSYKSDSTIADQLPPGKKWVRTPAGQHSEEQSFDIEDSLRMLCVSGETQLVGREAIDGEMTRHYRGEIQLGDFVDYLRGEGKVEAADAYERAEAESAIGITAEGWVDRNGRLRRLRMVMPVPGKAGRPSGTMDMLMNIFDYGAHPDIELPDPASVVDGPVNSGSVPTSSSID
ncbi:MAG: hypothetical protein ACTHO8_02375 [Solirubrobacterales bacterium]